MNKILAILIISIYLFSCSSKVRFTSSNNKTNLNTKSKSFTKSEKKDFHYNNRNDNINYGFGNQIVEHSKNWLGVPYKYGGINEDGIDCSAFVMKVYRNFGFEIPRTAEQQFDFTKKVSRETLQQGDLIFFKRRDKIFHVGIYIGQNQIIHASTSRGVIIQSLDDNWIKSNLHSFGRIV